eukprot:TRINITY_DN50694_c0_g1_i6.p4 TRINITY_DN50694_c0_g1~~TRINITY_DN50694_c0_g1_i6.p4  ORF type:complete len:115 (-),score=19.22 TRINITY_DN50694_c0_g1_i6:229-573(-)
MPVRVEFVQHVRPRGHVDLVAMFEADFARRPDRDRLGQPGIVDVEEGIGAQMLGDADGTRPVALGLRNLDMLGPDANGIGAVLGRHIALDEVHLGAADEARDELIPGIAVELER